MAAPLPKNATPSRAGTGSPEGPPHKRRGLRSARLNWLRPVLHSRALPTALVRRLSITELSAWPTGLNVDVMGAVRLVEAISPMMKAEGGGSILLVSSVSAIEAAPMEDFGYTAAKAALNAYAKKLAVVEGSHGIRANALLPGSTEFPGGGWEIMREDNPSIYEMVRQSVPSGRLATPKEVADAAVWLVSPRAGWVNGASLVVDGGQSKAIR